MDLALSAEDVERTTLVDSLLARESTPERVRKAEHLGFDPELWRHLESIGLASLASGSAETLVAVTEVAGRHLASAPVVETLVCGRLLGPVPSGSVTTLALHAHGRLVPAGAVADRVLWWDGATLRAGGGPAPMIAVPNLGGLPLADRDLSGASTVIAEGAAAAVRFERARHEWQLLTAAQLTGIAARALEIGVAYVREREVFGRPVGSFQTVAHRLADHATAVDGARLLVQEAAWALDTGDPRARGLATMAFCFASEHALAVARDALHFHGGYGFTLEYDVQLYYRRARAIPLVWGSVQREYQALAGQLFGAA